MSEVTFVNNEQPHWIKIVKFNQIKYMCSECRKMVAAAPGLDIGQRNYCADCGKKMEYVKL